MKQETNLICDIFHQTKDMEKYGTGIGKMISNQILSSSVMREAHSIGAKLKKDRKVELAEIKRWK